MSNVNVDIERAREILAKIDGAAQEYAEYEKQAQILADELEQCWQGGSGQLVHEKALVIKVKQRKIAEKILEASARVKTQLQELEATDTGLASAINHHSGGGRRG